MILGGLLLGVGMGVLSAASAVSGLMGAGTGTGGAEMERVLLFGFLSFLAGAVDTCLSTVLVYGFLTLRKWAYGVFVVWLPVKVVLAIIAYLSTPSFGKTADTKPFIIIFVTALTVILNIAALVVEFILVRRGNTALAEE
jgi:hypothetical protein